MKMRVQQRLSRLTAEGLTSLIGGLEKIQVDFAAKTLRPIGGGLTHSWMNRR